MAKKAKTIEIKSAPTEPQRGAGHDASSDDPVTIYYPFGGIARLIGSLAGGDEDEAVIKTGGCIVPGDITIRYNASTPPSLNIPIYGYYYTQSGCEKTAEPIGAITQYGNNTVQIPKTISEQSFSYNSSIGLGYTAYPETPMYLLPFSAVENETDFTVTLPGFDVTDYNPPDLSAFDCIYVEYSSVQ